MVTGLLLILLGVLIVFEPRFVVLAAGMGLIFIGSAVILINLWLRRVQRWERPAAASRGWRRFFRF